MSATFEQQSRCIGQRCTHFGSNLWYSSMTKSNLTKTSRSFSFGPLPLKFHPGTSSLL